MKCFLRASARAPRHILKGLHPDKSSRINTAWFSTVRFQPPPSRKLEVGNTLASAFLSAWDSLTDLPPRLSSFPRVAPSHLSGHTSMPPPHRGFPLARYLEWLLAGLSEFPVATRNDLLCLLAGYLERLQEGGPRVSPGVLGPQQSTLPDCGRGRTLFQ